MTKEERQERKEFTLFMFKVFTQVIEAFEILKKESIIHRDVKPDNIMLKFKSLEMAKKIKECKFKELSY